MALLIQLSPSPASRTSSTLLGLLSSEDAADLSPAVYRREFAGPDLPEFPYEEGRGRRDSETTSVEDIRDGPGSALRGEKPMNIEGVAL